MSFGGGTDGTQEERAGAWEVLVEKTPSTGRYAFDGARWYHRVAHDEVRAKRFLDAAFTAEPDNPEYVLDGE